MRLAAAAPRLGESECSTIDLLRRALPMSVAFTGRPPAQLTADDLDALTTAATDTQHLTAHMRRTWYAHVFGLHRRCSKPASLTRRPCIVVAGATREARLAVVASPEIRRTLLACIDARPAVPRP